MPENAIPSRAAILDVVKAALLNPRGGEYRGGGLADYSPDRADETELAEAVIYALWDAGYLTNWCGPL